MNPFQAFAKHRTRQVFPPSWRLQALLVLGLGIFFGGLGLVLQMPFQEALMVPGIIRSDPTGQVIKSPLSGRIDQVFVRTWDRVELGDLLVRFNHEELDLELFQLHQSLDLLNRKQEMYTQLAETITRRGPNPFQVGSEAYGHQLYSHFFQEYQVLVQAVQAKDLELIQYQSLPPAMQKQAILSGLILDLEALDGRVQAFIESFLLQVSQQLETLRDSQRDLNQGIQRVTLQRQSLSLQTQLPGQVIPFGTFADGDWVGQGQPLFLVIPNQIEEIYLELQIPQHQRSRITIPTQIRFFSQDRNPRSSSLVESELTLISDQPSSVGMPGSEIPGFLAKGSIGLDQYPWLIPGTTGVAWIQGARSTLASWILELLDLQLVQNAWWQRFRDRSQSRYSNPSKHRLTSWFWYGLGKSWYLAPLLIPRNQEIV